jgi:hypothetical protein
MFPDGWFGDSLQAGLDPYQLLTEVENPFRHAISLDAAQADGKIDVVNRVGNIA